MHHRPRNVGVADGVGAGCTVGDLAAGGRTALDGQAGGGDVVPAGVSFDAAPLDCVLRLEYQRIFGFKAVVNRRGAQEEVAHQVEPAAPPPVPASGDIVRAGATINSATICLIDSIPICFWAQLQKAPSIGIQTTQRSNWYSRQVDQLIINQKKQIYTDLIQVTPAHHFNI